MTYLLLSQTIIDDHRENLEAQLVCWDQLQSGKDEVAAWVNSMGNKLDDSLKNFDDAVSVESRLLKFKVCCYIMIPLLAQLQDPDTSTLSLRHGGRGIRFILH